MLKIHIKSNINFCLKIMKMLGQSILMILRLLLNTQIIWMIFIKTEEYSPNKKRKILIVFDAMITDMINNKNI